MKVREVHQQRAALAKQRPKMRFGAGVTLSKDDVERRAKKDALMPKTADTLQRFKKYVEYSPDGKKYRLRVRGKAHREWREMVAPLNSFKREEGQRANAAEKKRMFVNPVTGKKSYVFESMVDGIESKTRLRAKRSSNSLTQAAERTVYRKEAPGLHEYVYRNLPGVGVVLVRHDVFESDPRTNTMKLVKRWERKERKRGNLR